MAIDKVSAGQKVGKPSASLRNTSIDVKKHWDSKGPWNNLEPPKFTPRKFDRVKVRNVTGGDLPQGSVVELGDFLLDAIRNDEFWFRGETPDLTRVGWGITLKPIPANSIDEVLCTGVCKAIVRMQAEDHEYADREAGETTLKSRAEPGPVKILHVETGGEERECVVQLGGAISIEVIWFKLIEPLYLDSKLALFEPQTPYMPTGLAIPNHAKAYKLVDYVSGSGPQYDDEPIEVFDFYREIGKISSGDANGEGMWNGQPGFVGCALRRTENYTSDGETGMFRLSLPDWWEDAGSLTLDLNGDVTASIAWPHSSGAQDGIAFAANLQTAINGAITPEACTVRIIQDSPGTGATPAVFEVIFDTPGDRTTTVDSWSHDGTGSEPTIETLRAGVAAETEVSREAFDIIWMERQAQWINFKTSSWMGQYADDRCRATITRYDGQGVLSATQDYDVWDEDYLDKRWKDVPNNALGYATLDNRRNRYVIQHAERYSQFLQTTADGAQCPGATISIAPLGTLVTTAGNPLSLPVLSADALLLYGAPNRSLNAEGHPSGWTVIGAQQHEVSFVIDVLVDGTLKKKKRTIWANLCSTDEDVTDIAELTECPPPE